MKDITNNKINTVIVKALSRFGRNHIEVDNYLENIFPLYNIRFISVTENIDVNEKCASLDNIAIPIKSLINDLYAKDISDKVRTTLEVKKRNGEFIGVSALYGYIKDPKDKHKFIIDIESSYIVTKIFNMVLLGKSRKEIAEHLNNKGVLTPSLYKLQKEKINNTHGIVSNKWNTEIVTRILNNITNVEFIQGNVTEKINDISDKITTVILNPPRKGSDQKTLDIIIKYNPKKIIDVDKDNWLITENHHEPIIKKDKFNKVKNILDNKLNQINKDENIICYQVI